MNAFSWQEGIYWQQMLIPPARNLKLLDERHKRRLSRRVYSTSIFSENQTKLEPFDSGPASCQRSPWWMKQRRQRTRCENTIGDTSFYHPAALLLIPGVLFIITITKLITIIIYHVSTFSNLLTISCIRKGKLEECIVVIKRILLHAP